MKQVYRHRCFTRVQDMFVPLDEYIDTFDPEPLEQMIKLCDDLAKSTPHTAFAYKVNDVMEYFISHDFFRWPNHLDKEDSYGSHRSEGFSRNARGSAGRSPSRY